MKRKIQQIRCCSKQSGDTIQEYSYLFICEICFLQQSVQRTELNPSVGAKEGSYYTRGLHRNLISEPAFRTGRLALGFHTCDPSNLK
jgi:hypothetical protein